jgi:methyltransferase
MAAARLVELGISRRNVGSSAPAREGSGSRRTFPLVVALHGGVIGGTLLSGGRARPRWLALLLLVQPLRFWVISTLGRRWNARGAVADSMIIETRGPYTYVRHPNYAVIAIELFSLPAGFGALRLALVASALNALLIAVRVREEEALLSELPGYREHFEGKPRFLPGLF